MAAYFVIPNSFTGTGDQTVKLDNNVQIKRDKSERINQFGDNYFKSQPLGPSIRTYTVTLSNRPTTEIDLVESYIDNLAGDTINGLYIEEAVNGVVEKYSKDYFNGEVYSLNMSIREVYR
jgi:hypothetical protein